MKQKEMNDPLLNDRVVKKLFLNVGERSKDYFLLIASLATGIPVKDLKEDFELIHPEISLNKNIVNREINDVLKSEEWIISFKVNYQNEIYLINIDSFDEYKKGDFLYVTEFMETTYYIPSEEGLRIIDINLDYLRKKDYNSIKNGEVLERLLYLFVCSDKEVLDELYKGDKLMEEVRKEADRIVKDLDLLLYYDKDKMDQEYAYETGKGHGKKEEKLEIAKKMLGKSEISYISEITGLTEEEILNLKEE